MKRVPVKSSNIKSVGYDSEKRELEIEFVSGGVYTYRHVDAKTHMELMAAESKGRYFSCMIRDRYKFSFDELQPKTQSVEERREAHVIRTGGEVVLGRTVVVPKGLDRGQ